MSSLAILGPPGWTIAKIGVISYSITSLAEVFVIARELNITTSKAYKPPTLNPDPARVRRYLGVQLLDLLLDTAWSIGLLLGGVARAWEWSGVGAEALDLPGIVLQSIIFSFGLTAIKSLASYPLVVIYRAACPPTKPKKPVDPSVLPPFFRPFLRPSFSISVGVVAQAAMSAGLVYAEKGLRTYGWSALAAGVIGVGLVPVITFPMIYLPRRIYPLPSTFPPPDDNKHKILPDGVLRDELKRVEAVLGKPVKEYWLRSVEEGEMNLDDVRVLPFGNAGERHMVLLSTFLEGGDFQQISIASAQALLDPGMDGIAINRLFMRVCATLVSYSVLHWYLLQNTSAVASIGFNPIIPLPVVVSFHLGAIIFRSLELAALAWSRCEKRKAALARDQLLLEAENDERWADGVREALLKEAREREMTVGQPEDQDLGSLDYWYGVVYRGTPMVTERLEALRL